MAKKADGIKESTDSNATIEEEDTRGWCYYIYIGYIMRKGSWFVGL